MLNYIIFPLFIDFILHLNLLKKVILQDETTLSMMWYFRHRSIFSINNGRYQTLADIGRFNLSFRNGFFSKARKYKIYFTVAGASIKYRYRIPLFFLDKSKFKMTTKIIYVDHKWTYYLHKFIVKNLYLLY